MNVAGIVAVATMTIVFSIEALTNKDGISGYARDCSSGPPVPCPPPPLLYMDHKDHSCHQPCPVFHLPAVPVVAYDTFTIHKSETPPHTLLQLLLPTKPDSEKTTSCVPPVVSLICKRPSKSTLLGSLLSLF